MTQQLPGPAQAAIDAANAGHGETFLGLFGSRGIVDDWGRTFTGPAAIRSWSVAEFIGNGFNGPSHFTFRIDGASPP